MAQSKSSLRRPVTVAQAWSAPIVFCLLGVAAQLATCLNRPDATNVSAVIVVMIVAPAVVTALIARGLVGYYEGARVRGTVAILVGISMFALLIIGLTNMPWPPEPSSDWQSAIQGL